MYDEVAFSYVVHFTPIFFYLPAPAANRCGGAAGFSNKTGGDLTTRSRQVVVRGRKFGNVAAVHACLTFFLSVSLTSVQCDLNWTVFFALFCMGTSCKLVAIHTTIVVA